VSSPFEGLKAATVNGVSLAYRENGSGEPVVLVHGTGSDLRTWDGQIGPLSARHRTIAYSRRYARPNVDIEVGVDDQMLPHVEDLAGLLGTLDIPAAHLVGHSWGGFIALLTAIRHSQRVRSLVLLEPPVLPLFVGTPPRPSEILGLLVRRPRTALAIIKLGAGAFEPARKAHLRGDDEAGLRAFGRGVLGKASFEALSEARRQQIWENRLAARAQILGAGFPPLRDDEVRRVEALTLLLCGDRSPAIFHRLTDRLAELLPNVERAEIAGASHIMQEDKPLMVNETILGFLERQSGSGG